MAGRIRTIKPEVLDDELACSLTDLAWRVWVSLWVLCDDFGNVRAAPKYIAAQVWQDTTRENDAVKALEELRTKTVDPKQKPMIFLYGADGQTYAHIKGFDKHQRQDNRSKKPRVPAPPEGAEDIQGVAVRFAARIRNSPRRKSVHADPPRSGDHDQNLAALPPTSEIRPPRSDRRPPTPDLPFGMVGENEKGKARKEESAEPEPKSTKDKEHEKTPHQIVKECYLEAFETARAEKAPFGSEDGAAINALLKYLGEDVERACSVIRTAFTDKLYKDRATIKSISRDPARFCGAQLPLTGVVKPKDPTDWVPTDDPAREAAFRDGPKEGKAF